MEPCLLLSSDSGQGHVGTRAGTHGTSGGFTGCFGGWWKVSPCSTAVTWDGNSRAFQLPAWYWWDASLHLNGKEKGCLEVVSWSSSQPTHSSLSLSCSSSLPCSHPWPRAVLLPAIPWELTGCPLASFDLRSSLFWPLWLSMALALCFWWPSLQPPWQIPHGVLHAKLRIAFCLVQL